MLEEIIIAGSGGQGVLLLGEVLAIGSLKRGLKATWLPSYGPEMRGGTANCSVVISDEEIGSPMVEAPSVLVCFNQPSLDKFAPMVRKGGIIFANHDAIEHYPTLDGVEIIKINIIEQARALGNERTLNMVMLGTIMKKTQLINIEDACFALKHIWGEIKAQKLLPLNRAAMECGME